MAFILRIINLWLPVRKGENMGFFLSLIHISHAVVKKIRHGPAFGVEIGGLAILIYGAESFPKPARSLVGFFGEQVRRIRLGGPGEIVAERDVYKRQLKPIYCEYCRRFFVALKGGLLREPSFFIASL